MERNYKIQSGKVVVEIDEDGNIIKLFDREKKIDFVGGGKAHSGRGLKIWVKEGKLGRDPQGKLSHKFSNVTFEKPIIRVDGSSVHMEKTKEADTLKIDYSIEDDRFKILVELQNTGKRKLKQLEFFFSWDVPPGTNILIPGGKRYLNYVIPPFGRCVTKNLPFKKGFLYIIRKDGNGIKIEFSDLVLYVIYHRGHMCMVGGYTDGKMVEKDKSLKELISMSFCSRKNVYSPVAKKEFIFPEISKDPWFEKRFIHLILYGGRVDLGQFFTILENLRKIGYNGVILGIGKGMKYESYPQVAEKWSYTKNEMKEIRNYIKNLGMEIIPEFPTLGHQNDTNLIKIDRSIVEDPNNPFVYCTSNPKTYQVIFSLLSEIIEIFNPQYFHLTHDEVQHWFSEKRMGICEKCKRKKLWEIYSEDVNRLHNFLKSQNIRMTLWGDMLLDHRKFKICNCNGTIGNIYKAIDLIPKDVLIFDWHYHYYKSYPSLRYFRNKGFEVFPGMSFFKPKAIASFSRYSKKIGINKGAIETTWAIPTVEELPLEPIFIASQIFQNPDYNLGKLKSQAYQFAYYLYNKINR